MLCSTAWTARPRFVPPRPRRYGISPSPAASFSDVTSSSAGTLGGCPFNPLCDARDRLRLRLRRLLDGGFTLRLPLRPQSGKIAMTRNLLLLRLRCVTGRRVHRPHGSLPRVTQTSLTSSLQGPGVGPSSWDESVSVGGSERSGRLTRRRGFELTELELEPELASIGGGGGACEEAGGGGGADDVTSCDDCDGSDRTP